MTTTGNHPEQGPPPNPGPYVYPVQFPYAAEDEIDLFELIAGLWRRRVMIIAMGSIFALLSIIWVQFIAVPTYEVTARLRPPTRADLAPLKVQLPADSQVLIAESPDISTAFKMFGQELRSLRLQRAVFDYLVEERVGDRGAEFIREALGNKTTEQFFLDTVLPRLTITGSEDTKNSATIFVDVSFKARRPEEGVKFVERLIDQANAGVVRQAKEDFLFDVNASISSLQADLSSKINGVKQRDQLEIARLTEEDQTKTRSLNYEIAAIRESNRVAREDRIRLLQENLSIAQQLGLQEPADYDDLKSPEKNNMESLNVDVNGAARPLYLMGSRLLTAEIESLNDREDDDFTSPKLRQLQLQLSLLENNPRIEELEARTDYAAFAERGDQIAAQINLLQALLEKDLRGVTFVQIDLPPIVPSRPIKPKKMLIVAAATLAGGMLAVLMALVLNMRDERRARQPQ